MCYKVSPTTQEQEMNDFKRRRINAMLSKDLRDASMIGRRCARCGQPVVNGSEFCSDRCEFIAYKGEASFWNDDQDPTEEDES